MAVGSPGIIKKIGRYSWLLAIFIAWSAMYGQMIYQLNIHPDMRTALKDSLLANLHLAGACLIMLTILHFYVPGRSQYLNLLALVIALTVLWYLAFRFSWIYLMRDSMAYPFWEEILAVRLIISFLVIFCFALFSVLQNTREEKELQIKRKTDAEKLARDAELFRLQQQLQPHFLFNSLNSVSALAGTEPALARKMIQQLSEFLRGTLRKNEQALVPLDEELNLLALYLEIEKIRFGHRLHTRIENEPNCSGAVLPPLILQPLLENAIKYGLYDTIGEVHIQLSAQCVNKMLTLTVSNPFDQETSSAMKGSGFGLASVQRRLFLLFGRNDLCATYIQGGQFISTIKIPQQ